MLNVLRKSIPTLKRKGKIQGGTISFEITLLLLIAFFIIFKSFSYYLTSTNNIDKYIKLLNFNIPYIKTQVYEESEYVSKTSLTEIIAGGLNIKDISLYKIIGKEVSIFKGFLSSIKSTEIKEGGIQAFTLNTDNVYKMTEEEIAELNKPSEAYDASLKKPLDNTVPEVLIFHTHTTENYAERSTPTIESDFSVVGVGEVLAKELEEGYGISVIHDKTNHSISYNESYKRSNETLKKYLDEYGDFKLIIDIHRDGVSNKDSVTVELNNQKLAKLMFVTAENSDNYEANTELANNFLEISDNLFPQLFRPTFIYPIAATSKNHSLSENILLLEAGANINSAQESKLSAKYFARIVAEYLNNQ